MVDQNDGGQQESRPPTLSDLVHLCRELNRQGAKYIVIGGMAMIQAGFVRATEDIDLLIDVSPENITKLLTALGSLPDGVARELSPDDLEKYTVVKVADEFVVDLMKTAGGVDYEKASKLIEDVAIEGVLIPFASPELLWQIEQTRREKDGLDLLYLQELLKKNQ